MKSLRTLALLTSASLLLAACDGTRAPATTAAASIELSGRNDVKLNDPTTLTAVVKAANGTVLTDKKVVWTSSNSDVATVDANGVVTAQRFGAATITATVEGVKQTVDVRTYGLEAFAGVRESFDTAMFLRYRTADGKAPTPPRVTITVTGPTGWNNNAPVVLSNVDYSNFFKPDGSGSHWFEFSFIAGRNATIQPVVGTYQVKFEVGGETWTSSAAISSLQNSAPPVSNITVAPYNGSAVTGTWDGTVRNGSYRAGVQRYGFVEVKDTTATIPTPAPGLTRGQDYVFEVQSMSLDVTAPVETRLNGQFDTGYRALFFRP